MTYTLAIHDTQKGQVVAACDTAVLGETFEEDGVSLTVTERFYDGREATIDEICDAAADAVTTNFVGEQLIAALQDRGIVQEDEIQHVDDIPHVQLFYM